MLTLCTCVETIVPLFWFHCLAWVSLADLFLLFVWKKKEFDYMTFITQLLLLRNCVSVIALMPPPVISFSFLSLLKIDEMFCQRQAYKKKNKKIFKGALLLLLLHQWLCVPWLPKGHPCDVWPLGSLILSMLHIKTFLTGKPQTFPVAPLCLAQWASACATKETLLCRVIHFHIDEQHALCALLSAPIIIFSHFSCQYNNIFCYWEVVWCETHEEKG